MGRYSYIRLPTRTQTQHDLLHQVPGEDSAALCQDGAYWNNLGPTAGFCAMQHKQENGILLERKLYNLITPIICRETPLIMYKTHLMERPRKLCTAPNMNKRLGKDHRSIHLLEKVRWKGSQNIP